MNTDECTCAACTAAAHFGLRPLAVSWPAERQYREPSNVVDLQQYRSARLERSKPAKNDSIRDVPTIGDVAATLNAEVAAFIEKKRRNGAFPFKPNDSIRDVPNLPFGFPSFRGIGDGPKGAA